MDSWIGDLTRSYGTSPSRSDPDVQQSMVGPAFTRPVLLFYGGDAYAKSENCATAEPLFPWVEG